MKRILGVAAMAVVLAACSSETDADTDGDGTVSQEEMAAAAQDAIKPEPGQYRSTVKMVEVDIPGAPPEAVEMMQSGMGEQTQESCMTEEDAAKGFEEMAKGTQNGDCTTNKFVVNGGDIDAEMTCAVPGQGEMKMTMDGSGTSTSMDMTMTMEGEIPGMGDARMVMNVQSERIGDCS
ncbi:DUF3617 domain-containing protein [Erythrobacter sp. W53]|uniref:DUF3617 domain-containing protein n=1 Tax=Erythrobacter sp. W53 TaxID=3425947 RepID=UPI003D767140